MRIRKLYSEPAVFDEIIFKDGINLILGEKVEDSEVKTKKDRKTNGVGKSMCIEFINFCLLKSQSDSRVMLIPIDQFQEDTKIMLDVQIGGELMTIIRTKKEPGKPMIAIGGEIKEFSKLEDATSFLTSKLYSKEEGVAEDRPSFRQLLGPLIRDEGSEFKDIVRCYESTKNIPYANLAIPHLYFFRISVSLVQKIQRTFKKITDNQKVIRKIKQFFKDKNIELKDVQMKINSLTEQVERINNALESFRTNEGFEGIQNDLAEIERELDQLRARQAGIQLEVERCRTVPKLEAVKDRDIKFIYDQFKTGLGDMIVKSIQEVVSFKNTVEEFQRNLIEEKLKELEQDLEGLSIQIRKLEEIRVSKLQLIDQKGILKDFKSAFVIHGNKDEALNELKHNYSNYTEINREQKILKLNKDDGFIKFDAALFEAKPQIESFNRTIVRIHEEIMGNTEVSFDIKAAGSTEIVDLELRIDDDGSRSVERTKVFIYDNGLVFNEVTRERHPRFLIHDNIFDVDQDTLVESLNFLAREEIKFPDFQYILTLNRDKIENEERQNLIKLKIEDHIRAKFTRQNRFLKMKYQEM